MHIAVVGCGHGEIDKIFEVAQNIEEKRNIKVDLILCCGDFQSVRNMTDLRCMACPIKYQQMHDFHRYYSGEKVAPIPMLFIGGNHEASNYLQEFPYGGWVAPNIFYMGYTNVVKFGPLRIAGISGIFKGHDYFKGRFECPPYDSNAMRSVYHYRNIDTFRLKQVPGNVDIVLSHDWPNGIHAYGNTEQLLRRKPFFRDEIHRDELGSKPLFEVLSTLKPAYWFSAHLHVKFSAVIPHKAGTEEDESPKTKKDNPDLEQSNVANSSNSNTDIQATSSSKITKFLALDKVLPRRQFLQILEFPTTEPIAPEDLVLKYDEDWLAILRSTNSLSSGSIHNCFMPGPGHHFTRFDFTPTKEEIEDVKALFPNGDTTIPTKFDRTGPVYQHGDKPQQAFPLRNPQTTKFCDHFGVTDPLVLASSSMDENKKHLKETPQTQSPDSDVFCSSFMSDHLNVSYNTSSSIVHDSLNPDEISLDLDDDEEESMTESLGRPKMSSSVNTSSRLRLSLPPPKNSESTADNSSDDNDTNEDPEKRQKELDILQSVMSDSPQTLNSGLSFVIDDKGESPLRKKPKTS